MSQDRISRRKFVKTSAAAAATVAAGVSGLGAAAPDRSKIRSYNERMEYRPMGKTGVWVSAVCMGGHWKRIDKMVPGVFKGRGWLSADLNKSAFMRNRHGVISRCIDLGINHVDACTIEEVRTYARAIKGRRDRIQIACSWYQREMRNGGHRTKAKLLETLDWGLKDSGLEYADLWRITMHEKSSRHTEKEVEEMMRALETAKKQGKIRFAGFSSHDRPHIKWMIETYPDIVNVVVTPYTAKTKVLPKDSLFDTLKKYGVGCFGIKPFSSNSLFKGDSTPGNPHAEEDDRIARLAIRNILCNPAITAPIPGLINPHQVENVALAVRETRELDPSERADLDRATDEMYARLPENYQWLKDHEFV